MSKKEKPLPKPPSTPFGRKKSFEQSESREQLMADEMAMAAAEGKLDDYIKQKLPDNEHARKLAEMMMGMTGMMPLEGRTGEPAGTSKESGKEPSSLTSKEASSLSQPPADVISAVKSADVKGLIDLLKKEYAKRAGKKSDTSNKETTEPAQPQATIEKQTIEDLIAIAADNDLSIDWLFFRALKRYVEEYKKTGNL